MSILNLRFPRHDVDEESYPEHLRGLGLRPVGPMVQVTLSLTDDHRQVLLDMGKTLPDPVSGCAMIDTGAGSTCFDQRAARKAKLAAAGSTIITSATGSEVVPIYTGRLEVFGFKGITAREAFGARLVAPLIALIGRDVLEKCILVYNGPENSFSLSN